MEHCPQKLAKYLLNAFVKTYRNVKGVIDNAVASKVNCSRDIVVTCKPCWAGRTN